MSSLGVVTVVVLAAGQPVEVEPMAKAVRLLYVREAGAEACPEEAQVRAAVASRLGYDPFRLEAQGTLLARVGKGDAGMVASIELVDEAGLSRGKRNLSTEGPSCEEMARAISLSISIAVDPDGAARADTPPPAAPAEAATPRPPPPSEPKGEPSVAPAVARPVSPLPPVSDELPESPPPRTRLALSLAGVAMAGVAPSIAYGGGLMLQGRREAWSAGLGGRLLRSPGEQVAGSVRLEVTLAAAELSGCLHHAVFEHCLVGLGGASWVQSSGIARPGSDIGRFGAVGLRSAAVANVSPGLALFAQIEGLAVLAPIHPQVDAADVWAAPSVVGGLAAGGRAHFW